MGNSKEILKELVGPEVVESLDDEMMKKMRSLTTPRMKTVKMMKLLNSLYYDISFVVGLV